ncbi:PHA/PHB synthase family protein [Paraburkholderia fungorum]|uniref:PHA/PHB synthase family protein n=1 Tax=Paraburkholderia fungorum TaxID=134537 RepID=UPI00387814A0
MKTGNLASVTQRSDKAASLYRMGNTARPPAAYDARVPDECPQPRVDGPYNHLDRTTQAALAALTAGLSPAALWLAAQDWFIHLAMSPGKGLALTSQMSRALAAWAMPAVSGPNAPREADFSRIAPAMLPSPAHEDPRFAAPEWNQWPFDQYRDRFFDIQAWWHAATTDVAGVHAHHAQIVAFFARQWLDACSPSNFALTNPVVLDAARRTGGANFIAGASHWNADLEELSRRLRGAPRTAGSPFMPGREVAITPGKVVWRNAFCELLQYAPSTTRTAREPLLIVPSWIMKYYILDLQPHNSLIRYLVGEGYTVFAISWRNPGVEFRNARLNDYLSHGLLAALAEVRRRCDDAAVHAIGYCLGGTLVAIAAAALARDGHASSLRSVTLLAAQTDFSEPGELSLFIDESELAALDALMWEQGFLDGEQMAAAFQLLNARDLIWSRSMSEYLLGRRSKPNDLMAWNADTTRMPYRMHSEYLRGLFLNNDLAAGRYCVDGKPVVLSDIETPMFVVGTERDHVSPWRSVYKLHLLTHNALTFVLTSGGHNAGIVSEPGHPGRHYRWANREADAAYRSRHAFLESAEVVDGSWWPCLSRWLRERSSGEIGARTIVHSLTDAPGTYVLEQ